MESETIKILLAVLSALLFTGQIMIWLAVMQVKVVDSVKPPSASDWVLFTLMMLGPCIAGFVVLSYIL